MRRFYPALVAVASFVLLAIAPNLNAQIIFAEDFEGVTPPALPAAMTVTTNATDGGWNSTTTQFGLNWTIPAHTQFALTDDDFCNCDKSVDYLTTGSLDFTGYTDISLEFASFFFGDTYGGATEVATVEVSTDGGVTWTTVSTLTGAAGWTNETVNLNAYAGNNNVTVGFHYNDGGGWLFGWAVDDIQIYQVPNYDAELTSIDWPLEYTMIPGGQQQPLPGGTALVTNKGLMPVTGVQLMVDFYLDGIYQATIPSLPVASIAPGATSTFTVTSPGIPTDIGEYTADIYVVINETDGIPSNDSIASTPFEVTPTTYARDNGNDVASVGIGDGSTGTLGQTFEIVADAYITEVNFFLRSPQAGMTTTVDLYDFTTAPNSILASTGSYTTTIADSNGVWVNLTFTGGPYFATAGTYYLGVNEPSAGNITLATTDEIVTPMTLWINFPGTPFGTWAPGDSFAALIGSANFTRPYMLRAEIDTSSCGFFGASVTGTDVSCVGDADGSATVTLSGGSGFSYNWSSGGTAATETGLAPGTYTVTVSETSLGCNTSASVTIGEPTALNAAVTGSDALCFGANNASVSVTPSGGTAPYAYSWSTGGTGSAIVNQPPGSYTVTVTDGNGCTSTGSATVSEPTELTASVSSTTDASSSTAADGQADIDVAGGSTPYTFSWSSGATTEDLTGATAGVYSVTVTDANGCETTISNIEINFNIGIEDINGLQSLEMFPNPTAGMVTVSLQADEAINTSIKLYDIAGAEVMELMPEQSNSSMTQTFNLSELPNGTYLMKFTFNGEPLTQRLIIAQ